MNYREARCALCNNFNYGDPCEYLNLDRYPDYEEYCLDCLIDELSDLVHDISVIREKLYQKRYNK